MTELVWAGKYKDGKKVAPVRIALPFQTIETVNESAQERQRSLDLFASGREPEWRTRTEQQRYGARTRACSPESRGYI